MVYEMKEGPAGETLLWSPARHDCMPLADPRPDVRARASSIAGARRERSFTPEEVSAMVLKHLVGAANEHLNAEVQGAVRCPSLAPRCLRDRTLLINYSPPAAGHRGARPL